MNKQHTVSRSPETRISHYENAGFLFHVVPCHVLKSLFFASIFEHMDAKPETGWMHASSVWMHKKAICSELTRRKPSGLTRRSSLIETPWSEIDLKNETLVIPWQRMKMGKKKIHPRKLDHQVNLPRQGWLLLHDLHKMTGGGTYYLLNS